MTDRELLKEARDALVKVYSKPGKVMTANTRAFDLVDRIDYALSDTGNTDAGQLVGQIRDHFHSYPDEDGIRKTEWDIDIDEAAALIEGYAKRVPRAMLEEIEKQAFDYGKEVFLSYESVDQIAAKYDYKVEDKHE